MSAISFYLKFKYPHTSHILSSLCAATKTQVTEK